MADIPKSIKPSACSGLEIAKTNNYYLTQCALNIATFGRGIAWFDARMKHSLLDASNFITIIGRRQGLKIVRPEEIACRSNWLDDDALQEISDRLGDTSYGKYLPDFLLYVTWWPQ